MAVKRVEWSCPQCGRKFGIPASARTPSICPTCKKQADSPPREAARGIAGSPATEQDAGIDFPVLPVSNPEPVVNDDSTLEEPFVPRIEPEPVPRTPTGRRKRHKYPALRFVRIAYKVFAALAAVAALLALFATLLAVVASSDAVMGTISIAVGIEAFIACAFAAVSLLALGEMIQVALDIESNTRQPKE